MLLSKPQLLLSERQLFLSGANLGRVIDFALDRQGRDRGREKQEPEGGKDTPWMSPSETRSWAGAD